MARGLAWVAVLTGAAASFLPTSDPLWDVVLAPLVMAILFQVVEHWVSPRCALVAIVLYMASMIGSLTVLNPATGGLAARNLACLGSAQLLVGLGGVILVLGRALPPLQLAVFLVLASRFQPQVTFVPLLTMTLLEPRTLLLRRSLQQARGTALRSAGLCVFAQYVLRGLMITDAVTLPVAWWISSWLLAGEIFMPTMARGILVAVLCASTVAGFRAWPGIGMVLLLAFVVSLVGQAQGEAAVSQAREEQASPMAVGASRDA